MERVVEPERLDHLPPSDPGARQSRRDLRRINRIMGNAGFLRRAIAAMAPGWGATPWTVLEVGAGDGSLASRIWNRLPAPPSGSRLLLLDRLPVIDPSTVESLRARNWNPGILTTGIESWIQGPVPGRVTLIYANLFLHHFDRDALRELLHSLAPLTDAAVFVEPRRSPLALLGARCLGLLGCHPITREDAVTSVRAGFRGTDLTTLWPASEGWQIEEGPAGPFAHRFSANRIRTP